MKKKIIAAALAVSMLGAVNIPAVAVAKEEVVYVLPNADGSIDKVYAVNSFDGGDITDYGEYSSVKLLNIDGEITQNGDKISFSSPDNQKV